MAVAFGPVDLGVRAAARAAARRPRARRRRSAPGFLPIPLDDRDRHRHVRGELDVPARSARGAHDARRHRHRLPDPRLLDRLHAGRAARRLRAVLLLPEPVLLLHARARARRQLPRDVRRLGGRRALLVPADRLLVREAERRRRRQEGVHRQPHRRLGLPRSASSWCSSRSARSTSARSRRGGGDAGRDARAFGVLSADLPCCCSSARRARARRSRCTSGCRTRWKGRRRSRR